MTDAETKRLWALANRLEDFDYGRTRSYDDYGPGVERGMQDAGDELADLLTELGYPRPEGE